MYATDTRPHQSSGFRLCFFLFFFNFVQWLLPASVCLCVCMYDIHTYIRTYVHKYIHTYTHIYIYSLTLAPAGWSTKPSGPPGPIGAPASPLDMALRSLSLSLSLSNGVFFGKTDRNAQSALVVITNNK